MAAPKSILLKIAVDEVLKSHNCQHNSKHRLVPGDRRLKVTKDRSPEHYCVPCAIEIIERDVAKLQLMSRQLRGEAEME